MRAATPTQNTSRTVPRQLATVASSGEIAQPGEVLVSHTVRDLARTSASATFEDRGDHELKGVSDP